MGDPHNPQTLQPHIKVSKTDPFCLGVYIFVRRTHSQLCLVEVIKAYLAMRSSQPGPLFLLRDGKPLTHEAFIQWVCHNILTMAGIDCANYAGHSFQIGTATIAAACNIEDSLTKTGLLQSSAYQVYVRIPREWLAAMTVSLASSGKNTQHRTVTVDRIQYL